MATRERDYTIDDVWRMASASANEGNRYTLIDGELFVTMSPGQLHAEIAPLIAHYLLSFVLERALGRVTVEAGYHPPGNRRTLLLPDVAFEGLPRAAQPARLGFVPYMPDLAVEIISPSQDWEDMRAKAEIYLRHGTSLVWLIYPKEQSAEMWTSANDSSPQSETVDVDGELNGGAALPGFSLPLRHLFPD